MILKRSPRTVATNGSPANNRKWSSFANSTSDVSKLLKFASQEKIPVTARGAGFGYVGGCVPVRKGIALSLMRMNRIKEISFVDAIAIVEPGVITADLKAAARAQKLFYPPDPASMNDCSIGGNIATNAGGPRCLKYGVTRNYVIGLEVVLANGDVLADRRARSQKQNRLRFDRSVCRLGRNARRRHRNHAAFATVAAGPGNLVGCICNDVTSRRGGAGDFRRGIFAFIA